MGCCEGVVEGAIDRTLDGALDGDPNRVGREDGASLGAWLVDGDWLGTAE